MRSGEGLGRVKCVGVLDPIIYFPTEEQSALHHAVKKKKQEPETDQI